MESLSYQALEGLFGGGLTTSVSKWMNSLFTALLNIISDSFMTSIMSIFVGIACALLTLYFFLSLIDQAGKDMFSVEKLILAFIRYFTAVCFLICLKDLVVGCVKIGDYMYKMAASSDAGSLKSLFTSSSSGTIRWFPSISRSTTSIYQIPSWKECQAAGTDNCYFAEGHSVISYIGTYAKPMIMGIIIGMISAVITCVGYFICTANALKIIVKATFSPLAVVQMFGMRGLNESPGMKYLKGFLADCITMSVILVTLYAANALTTSLLMQTLTETVGASHGVVTIEWSEFTSLINFSNIPRLLLPSVAAIGAMGSANKIAHDIFL